ncbi:MAG: PAS domain S-box protein [Phaeospirillum sp.]|nr:PAS domain S-box protein [Phaeospirillum sp.]
MALSFGLLFSAALLLLEWVQLFGLPLIGFPGAIEERRQNTVQMLNRLADFKKDQLTRWLSERRANTRLMSANQQVAAALREAKTALAAIPADRSAEAVAKTLTAMPSILAAQRYMEEIRTGYQVFSSIQLLDAKSGRVLVSTPSGLSVGADLSRLPLLERAREVGQREVIVHQGGAVPILSIVRQITEPTPDGGASLLGLMIFQFDLNQIITSSASDDAQSLGRTGKVLVVGADGTALARSPDAVREAGAAIPPDSRLPIGGNEGVASSTGAAGQPVMAAYRYIHIAPDMGWGLVVSQDEAEFLAPVNRAALRWFGFSGLVLGAVLLLTGVVARRLTLPIRSLSDAAQRVHGGDFNARAQPVAPGELGVLVGIFNQMVERVGKAHHSLERLVEDRTRNLTGEIASRVEAETRALRLLTEKEALLSNSMVGIYMTERRVFTVCNRHLEVMLGYEPGEMIGQRADIAYPTEELCREHSQSLYQSLLRKGRAECDLLLRRKDGSTFWAYISGHPMDPGDPKGVSIWMMIDISARKAAEDALAQSEERYKEIVEGTNAVVTAVDAEGRFLFVNEAAARIFGLTSEQCAGRLAFDFVHPDDRLGTIEAFRRWVAEGRANIEHENRQISVDGKVSHLLWTIRTHFGPDGAPLRFTSIARDTTELRKAQTTLRLTQYSVDNAGEAVCWMTADLAILYANKAAGLLSGVSLSHEDGSPLAGLIGNEPAQQWRDVFTALAPGETTTFEARITPAHGKAVEVEVTASKVTFDGYERNCVFFRDIRVRKETEERLIRTNTELEQFAFIASHDLREPLRMVKLYVALLERRMERHLDTDTREFMGFVVDSASRMDSLINDLLEYSRTGRNVTPPGPVDLQAAFASVMTYLRGPLEECGGAIELESRLPTVTGDEGEMVRLFQNLIGNAIKYRSPQQALRIVVAADSADGYWRVSISDNGIGISPEYREKIFRVFQRLHAPGAHGGGTGIGLAICKKIIEHRGGNIRVESEPGRGATFIFTLPMAVPADQLV